MSGQGGREFADESGADLRHLVRHVMAAGDHFEGGAGDLAGDPARVFRRAVRVELSGHDQRRACDARKDRRHVEVEKHAVGCAETVRVVVDPAGAEGREQIFAPRPEPLRIAAAERVLHDGAHAGGLEFVDPFQPLGFPLRRNAHGGADEDDAAGALRVPCREGVYGRILEKNILVNLR